MLCPSRRLDCPYMDPLNEMRCLYLKYANEVKNGCPLYHPQGQEMLDEIMKEVREKLIKEAADGV